MPWIPTPENDRILRCSECDATFPVGRSCNCPVGGASVAHQSADHEESRDFTAEALPTTADYERELHATLRSQRRLRRAIVKAPIEDEHVMSDDGRRGTWRQAWLAEHSKLRLRIQALDVERKTLETLHVLAVKRELPDLVERYEKLKAALDGRKRPSRTRGAEARAH